MTREYTPGTGNERWPSGNYVDLAVIALSEKRMRELLAAEPQYGVDSGLGPWVLFGGRLSDGTMIEFVYHAYAPGPHGFDFRVDAKANYESVFLRVLRLLRVERTQLAWISDLVVDTR